MTLKTTGLSVPKPTIEICDFFNKVTDLDYGFGCQIAARMTVQIDALPALKVVGFSAQLIAVAGGYWFRS